jgi:thiosulfate/3-mercaptopyruvate sulfurtransferase
MSRYVVIGAGAVGATVAAQLREAGIDVVLVARGRNLEALQAHGLRYHRPDGTRVLEIPVVGGPGEITLQEHDVLVLATKSQDTEAILQQWRPLAAHLPVVVLQNGLENERAALRRFTTVIGASVWLPSSHLLPGEVVSPAEPAVGALWLGAYPQGEPPEELIADFTAAGFLVTAVPDIQRWKAGKLVSNVTNALDALYRPSPLRRAAVRALRAEARSILSAAGFGLAEPDPVNLSEISEAVVIRPTEGHERGGSSTWQSLARHAPPETDFLNGEIVLQARLHGREAPLNAAITERLQRAAGIAPGTLDDADLAATLPDLHRATVLISAQDLHDLDDTPVLLDVRWALGDPHGREHYLAGHLPGAVYVDLDTELAAPPSAAEGRHPLPSVPDLQAAARRWGIRTRRPVVVYDDNGGTAAARAWWLLKWAGVEDVRLLDGALGAWVAADYPLSTKDEQPAPGDVTLTPGHLPVLTADEAAALAEKAVLLDARAGERYRGEVEPVDPRAGHIPGAQSAPTGENLTGQGTFLATAELRARFRALGADGESEVGVYCGSGVTAAHEIAALAVAGVQAALYPGSWSAWSADPDRPAATGDARPKGDPR